MNILKEFDLERISQAIEDLKGCMMTDVEVPQQLLYRDGRMEKGKEQELRPFGKGDTWGGFDEWGWFRYTFEVPASMEGKQLWVEIAQDKCQWYAQNPQFLLYCNGEVLQGLDVHHEECLLREQAKAGEILQLDFDSWAGMVTRDRTWSDKENRPGTFALRLYCADPAVRKLYYDLKTPYEVLKYAGRESKDGLFLEKILEQAISVLDFRQPGSREFCASVERASEILEASLYGKEKQRGWENVPTAAAVGHTHIDVAWMWRFAHTKEKVQRSFSTALKLLEEYPQYIFMSSQPQLYEYLSESQPGQFEKIKKYVREGRWEPEGGMWVEADCNLTSGESLVRQFLVGKQYLKENFGTDSRVLWLPDVFGYSAALPQICKKCGIDYFMTTKISWNEMNKIPCDTFMWKGIDGTEILTHFAPAKPFDKTDYNPFGFARSPHITTYNGMLEPDQVMGGWKRYSQKQLNSTFLIPYGYGDGGGGTTREMIEKGSRMAEAIPGCPKVEFSTSLDFFKKLEEETRDREDLPVWDGELYLEFHRGTYTSVSMVKRMNRRAENLLQQTEFLMSTAQANGADIAWDKEEWKKMLKTMLTNQFHDILPGSALTEVYEDVEKTYVQIFEVLGKNRDKALCILGQCALKGELAVVNSLGFDRSGLVGFSWPSDADALCLIPVQEGRERAYAQKTKEGSYIAWIPEAKAGALSVYRIEAAKEAPCLSWDGSLMENDLMKVLFAVDGTLASVYDKEEGREVLSGCANRLETYEDRPYQYDAWEVSPYYRKKEYGAGDLVSMKLVENGPVRACIRQERHYLSSVIVQDIFFYHHTKRIDFHTRINWKESHIMLKTAFPVDIRSSKAVYEIQFGTVERPTHTNTSWDAEKFETCAQRFADLSEPDYGAALLNDCKYGYDVHDGVLRLTLLRSPVFPNNVDTGFHEFTYSFLPHKGTYRQGRVQENACDLNNPLITVAGSGSEKKDCRPVLVSQSRGIFTETLKPAEDGNGYIARVYEGFGCRRKAEFFLGHEGMVFECTMLEDNLREIEVSGNRFEIVFKPFEIKTFRIRMQKY